ncbi:MAG: ATP-binding protein [Dehalococcoidia bacterium]|nr:ATP-binding protein [Dehalococcoidia bacterium]
MESLGDILKNGPDRKTTIKAGSDTSSAADRREKKDICPICGGAEFVHPLTRSGRPDYSRVVPCRCVRERIQKERLAALEKLSNLGTLTRMTFDTILPQGRRGDSLHQQKFSRAFEAARSFAARPEGWLVFIGPAGSGKTHLAAAIANERLKQGQPVFYITTADLLDHLRRASSPNAETTTEDLFDQVKNIPLLVIDDLNLETATAWGREKVEQLLNHRFNARMPTIITVDRPLEELDERLRARLDDTEFCKVFTLEEGPATLLEQLDSMGLQLLKNMTFKSFDTRRMNLPPEQRQNLEQACRLALNFAQSPQGWLVLQGESGSGKTHLAAAIANYQLEAGRPVLFISVSDLLDRFRAAFSPESKVSYDELFDKVKQAPLLILDGLEGQSTTTWAQEKLYQLLNYRYNAQLPTVITTRLSLQDLADIDDRIGSRMADPRFSTVFPILVPNYLTDLKPRKTSSTLQKRPRRGA